EIVAGDGQRFVHAACKKVILASDGSTGRYHRRHRVNDPEPAIDSPKAPRIADVGPIRDAIEPEHDASVLDRAIRVVQHRAHQADPWTKCLRRELGEPAGMDGLDVVVEQYDDFAIGGEYAAVA